MKTKQKPILYAFMILASLYFLFQIGKDLITAFSVRQSLSDAQIYQQDLKQKKRDLQKEMEDWTNPDFLDLHIRTKFHLSAEDEQIFLIPDADH